MPFDSSTAFSRTLGFVTPSELESLRGKRVAVAGLGGVGGSHLITLTRLGIGKFHIADFDTYALENFNRQAGADVTTIGRPKTEVMQEIVRKINPELEIKTFSDGVNAQNIDAFLEGVDVYVDSLDFFAFKARAAMFEACRKKGIPAVTVGPIGMGAALLTFLPGQMSFREYFQWKTDETDETLAIKFLVGLAPSTPHRKYVVDSSYINLAEKRGPSTPMACELSAGIAGTEVLKILLKRGRVFAAPHSIHFDAFENRLYSRKVHFGNKNPIQRLKIFLGKRQILKNKVPRASFFHLFEFMDQKWLHGSLRQVLREILEAGNSLPFRGYYKFVTAGVLEIAHKQNASTIFEVGAGTAPISRHLAKALNGSASAIKLCPSDINPDHNSFLRLAAGAPGRIDPIFEPVDFTSTQLLEKIDHDSLVLFCANLHHLETKDRVSVLKAILPHCSGVVIAEPLRKSLSSVLFCFLSVVPALLLPLMFVHRRGRLARFFWCWLVPVAPMMFVWDGVASALRQWEPSAWDKLLREEPSFRIQTSKRFFSEIVLLKQSVSTAKTI